MKKTRVLLVDDSKSFLSGIENLLVANNYDFYGEESPKKALAEIEKIKPNIIITDLAMSEMHGFDFIREIRKQNAPKHIPILVLTGNYNATSDMELSIACGADAFSDKEHIRYTLMPQIHALVRLSEVYEDAIKGRELNAVQTLIGTYKHEFGNSIAIIDGMLRKYIKNTPEITNDTSIATIQKAIIRMMETLTKLNELREYQEDTYSKNSKILKVG